MLLALFLLAAPASRPPARVVVPPEIKKQREAEAAAKPPVLPLFADPRLTEALGTFNPHPGAWVEYAVLPKKGPQTRLKLSVLPDALPGGRYWLEAQSQRQDGPPIAMKLLLHGAPGRLENLERLYVYIEGLAPQEFPVDDARTQAPPPAGPLPRVERRPAQELKLGAGTFRCEELRVKDARIFRSAKVPLWGLVRALDAGQRIELVGFAESGAESVFPPEFDQGKGSESKNE